MTSQVRYKGNLRTEATHLQSGTVIETDAPKDNHGLGERFSPTDMVATSLGTCMLSIMGIAGRTHGIDIEGTLVDIEKIMVADPLFFTMLHPLLATKGPLALVHPLLCLTLQQVHLTHSRLERSIQLDIVNILQTRRQ